MYVKVRRLIFSLNFRKWRFRRIMWNTSRSTNVPNVPPALPEENLQKPFLAYVFCHCFLINRLTKMIRTLLESSDHAEKVAKTIGAPRWLCHALKMRYAGKS